MKNTLENAKFRIMIYKTEKGYIGICYETGWVEVFDSHKEAKEHLINGIQALMMTLKEKGLSNKNINRTPSLKYRFIFHTLPVVASFINSIDFSLTSKAIAPNLSY